MLVELCRVKDKPTQMLIFYNLSHRNLGSLVIDQTILKQQVGETFFVHNCEGECG